jgi:sarcosine oxidase subunit beta
LTDATAHAPMRTAGSSFSDVIIVGAGIVGVSTAYYLAKKGVRVTVLEARDVAAGTSGACDGNIMLQSKRPGPVLEMAKAGTALYPRLVDELDVDVEYERSGSMVLFEDEIELSFMKPLIESQRAAGLDVRLLQRREALEIQPGLAGHVVGASFLADDASVNQLALCFALARAAQRMGSTFQFGSTVTDVIAKAGTVSGVRTDRGDVTAPKVLLAAGVWSPEIARTVGLDLPIVPRKGHILVGEKCEPLMRTHLISSSYARHKHHAAGATATPLTGRESVSFTLGQTRSGTLFIGSSREFVGFDDGTDPEIVRAIARTAVGVFPPLANVHVIRSFAGLRPYTPDGRPILGEASACTGLYIAAGHEGDGIALGPITGSLMADLIADGACGWDLTAFSPQRFGAAGAATAHP